MARKVRDLTGQTYGKISVIQQHVTPSKRATFWDCKCECGNEVVIRSADLTGHKVKSCGCMPKKSPSQTYVVIDGEEKTLREWANTLGLSTGGLMRRLDKGGFTLTRDENGYVKRYEENDDYRDLELAGVPHVTDRYWEK